MCYSAMVEQRLKSLRAQFNAGVDYARFEALFKARAEGADIKIAKALECNFEDPQNPEEERIQSYIAQHREATTKKLEAELFRQRRRLVDAERKLTLKETKAAREAQRISTNKIAWCAKTLSRLHNVMPEDNDSRIFPMWYAPVIVQGEDGYLITPMRYHCRPAGKPASYDRRYDGLYNARRDNLEHFWKGQFGRRHAVCVITGFFENVARHDFERREIRAGEKPENIVLRFQPAPPTAMVVACIWDKWEQPEEEALQSFAIITDDPPPEIAATGHDRCPIILADYKDWLAPENFESAELQLLLEKRDRPLFTHVRAA